MKNIYCLFFSNYETLDMMGPVAFLSRLPDTQLHFVSQTGGLICSQQGFMIATKALTDLLPQSILLIVGGQGTRPLVNDTAFLQDLTKWVQQSQYCLSVCTGSALLAAAGCLNGRRATSNKRAFSWVKTTSKQVEWQAKARWLVDGKFYTASGVSAGMDMVLGFIADHYGKTQAQTIATHMEYHWITDPTHDDFAASHNE